MLAGAIRPKNQVRLDDTMPHSLISGMTESGKTTLAVQMSREYQRHNIRVIVLDPLLDSRWCADFMTTDRLQFLSVVQHPQTVNCAIFIDESGESVGQYNDEMFWLATRARHYGHNSHFICQRPAMLSPTVRGQCSYLYLFNVAATDAKTLSDDFNKPELKNAAELQKGEYYYCGRFGGVEKHRVDFNA
jgi:hypothetical protein